MASLVVGADGENYLLDRAVKTPWLAAEDWTLRLYKNDYTPTKDVILSNLVESDFPGYAPVTLTRATWQTVVQQLGRAVTFYGTNPQVFGTTGAPQIAYGYYITVPSLGILLLAQRFDVPWLVQGGSPALVLPQLTLHSDYEP